jgi:hypothetical protein
MTQNKASEETWLLGQESSASIWWRNSEAACDLDFLDAGI